MRPSRERLIEVVRQLAIERQADLDHLKANRRDWERADFVWHFLLQSFATMGRSRGWHGLIGTASNYQAVTYDAVAAMPEVARPDHVERVCRVAKVRMPRVKARYLVGCFDRVTTLGGPIAAKADLVAQAGREAKVVWWQRMPGIGPKYARNIMMDVYHEEFRDCIAVDVRIRSLSDGLGVSFSRYRDHEAFYQQVAQDAGLEGWELDRILYNFLADVRIRLGLATRQRGGVRGEATLPRCLTPNGEHGA